ncbi:MAG: histidine phosphatase family protein [Rickettsia sp.]|nr:histidine phosphatase family protein [Rickettsia sp.]
MNLFLMRHADAISQNNTSDEERNLSSKGRLQAIQTASFLQTHYFNRVIISSVKRALETFKIINKIIKIENMKISDNLYKKNEEEILEEIKLLGGDANNLLVIGHNPSISRLVQKISLNENTKIIKENNVSPASVIVINCKNITNWSNLNILVKTHITEVFVPKIWE